MTSNARAHVLSPIPGHLRMARLCAGMALLCFEQSVCYWPPPTEN